MKKRVLTGAAALVALALTAPDGAHAGAGTQVSVDGTADAVNASDVACQ
ncbi:hypothetical protein KMZ29_11825 [Bradyrhizobium sediminis]|uniref:DUF680 domain-containing protein n=1 Tax=Bradyrhizobium sediminis TaxID=2840469 RepID=A0A975NHJ6_9BRAD|nr:hypothetical protein [Bradyrhizobium sediminis]QWG15278.1 hypothetical protein KMZ29_11825 [Bradyrhizobium sediminis]